MIKTLIAMAAFALVTGKLEAKPAPLPKTGTVIVYRKPTPGSYLSWDPISGFLGAALGGVLDSATPYPLRIDGKPVCKLRYDCYYKLELAPGDYVFSQSRWFGHQSVHVVSGQIVYFSYYRGAYHTEFQVAKDQNEARQDVSRLTPQN